MALGYLFSWIFASYLCKKVGRNSDALGTLVSWLMIAAIVGARVAYVWEHWETEFAQSPMQIFRVDQGGLMFYGGFIGASLSVFLFAKLTHQKILAVTDLILTVLPLGHAIGRIGCFFHGCCFGRLTKSAIGVCFPKYSPAWYEQMQAGLISEDALKSLPVIPSQLIESTANFILFLILFSLFAKKEKQTGFQTGCYLISYACIRFGGEYLRGDPRMAIGFLSIGQTISLCLLILGAVILSLSFVSARKKEKEKQPEQ